MLVFVIAAFLCDAPASKGLTLSGKVTDKSGRPLSKATVFIRTAAPARGSASSDRPATPDCAKSAVTNAKGQFALKDLDPELVFRLLAVAEGYTPAFLPKPADPTAGPVSFTLTPHDLDKRNPALMLKGRVLDENRRLSRRRWSNRSGSARATAYTSAG